MKLKSISMYMLSLAGMLGLWSCSTDEAISGGGLVASGETVPVTITISRGAQTRTELSENTTNGGLNQVWSEGDVVKLYNSNGDEAGTLTLQSGADTPDGIFKGGVKGETGTYRLWYFGKPQTDGENSYPYLDFSTTGQVKLDLQNQNFKSLDELGTVDILSTNVNIVVKDNQGTVEKPVTMEPYVAMARFKMSGIPEGTSGTVKIYNNLNSDRGGIYAKQPLLLSTGVQQGENGTTASFTYDGVKNGDDIYVAFLPNPYTLHFEFEASNGAKYTHTFGQNNIEAGVYYRSFNKGEGEVTGIEVPFKPLNPADMDFWVLDDLDPDYEKLDAAVWTTDDDMWLVNCRNMVHGGGYGKKITYLHNGIKSGLLASSFNKSCIYFQWGRWLGYPKGATNIRFNWNGSIASFKEGATSMKLLPGIGQYGESEHKKEDDDDPDMDVTYLKYNFPVTYGGHPMGGNNSWTNEKAINYSILYGMNNDYGSIDYIYLNEVCEWEDRSGNPCPDGMRLPTADELEVLIPLKTEKILGSWAEVKTVNEEKYAMQWKIVSDDVKCIEIRSFKIDSDKVEINDTRFDDSKVLVLAANGYLNNIGDFYGDGVIGTFWSNETGQLNNGTYGGVYLYLEFSSNSAVMQIDVIGRTFGLNVIPVRDGTKKSATLTPILPINVDHSDQCPYF